MKLALALASSMLAGSAGAQTVLTATLNNASENPPTVPTTAGGQPRAASFGTASFFIDSAASFMTAMFAIAAALEAFWSSARWVPAPVKIGVGTACWVAVIAYFLFQGRPRRRGSAR